jgi:hypothetical protein
MQRRNSIRSDTPDLYLVGWSALYVVGFRTADRAWGAAR